jgi:hypothetical protein
MKKILICLPLLLMHPAQADEVIAPVAGEHAGHGVMRGMGKPVSWTTYPTLKMRSSGESREKMVITVMAKNIVPDQIDAYSNNLKDKAGHRILPIEMAGAVLDKPSTGGFHWLSAREVQGDLIKVASTVNFFSNPGKNPTVMFMQQKNELEVIPQPYPREHSRYRANEDWPFLVRFNSRPLSNQKMTLETSNGSRVELTSDLQGLVKLRLPDDFKAEDDKAEKGQHNHGRKSGDFVLATEHVAVGKTYLTAFNSSYGPDAFDGRSLAWGLGFTLLGMAGATPLLRQRVKKSAAPATKSTES